MENLNQAQLALSPEELARMESLVRQKQQSHHKKSIDKRSSMRIKNIPKQFSSNFNKDQLSMVDTLAGYLQNIEKHLQQIDEFCIKRRISYLCELKSKLTMEEYKYFLSNIQLFKIFQGGKMQEEGKFHGYHYIIIEGCVAAYREKKAKDEEKEYVEAFQFQSGEVVLSNTLQTHKYNPYTVRAKKLSLLLRFNEETYIRSIKRIYQKEIDQLATTLCHTLPFRGIPANQMKKYVPYCSFRRFSYNQLVYSEGDIIRQLFLILHGQAEIGYETEDHANQKDSKKQFGTISPNLYKVNHQANDKKQVKIVRVGKRQLFGLQAQDVFNENYYQHHVRVVSDTLKVLSIGLDVLYDIQMENPTLQDNLNSYIKKITTIHDNLFERYQRVNVEAPKKKKKKKRKMKRKSEISLQWWGLAQKIQGSKRYRLPTPPHSSQKSLVRKEPLQIQNRTSKLDYFKRRLFEQQIEGLQELQEKENDEPNYPQALVPKLQKMKIKMINPRPKVINNAERIKRKLVDYAKNGEIYCDKLQLQ